MRNDTRNHLGRFISPKSDAERIDERANQILGRYGGRKSRAECEQIAATELKLWHALNENCELPEEVM